ncbi:MAG: NmrA family NAD(P)-binding protein [Ilumatobacteraceae bacterium]
MILVAGGTGRLGSIVVGNAVAAGRTVRVLTRAASRAEHLRQGVEVMTGDVRDPDAVRRAVDGCDLVVSAVHGLNGSKGSSPATVDRDGNANLIDAARACGADVIVVSGVGAAADSPIELFRMKWAAEQHAFDRGGPTTVVRATAFAELWIDLLRRSAKRSGRPMVFGHGVNPINFVSVIDVAALIALTVDDRTTRGEILEIGGPANLTATDLARAVQAADGREGRPRHLPPFTLRLARATVGQLKPEIGRQTSMALAMDRDDFSFDTTPIHQRFPTLPTTAINDLLVGHEPSL